MWNRVEIDTLVSHLMISSGLELENGDIFRPIGYKTSRYEFYGIINQKNVISWFIVQLSLIYTDAESLIVEKNKPFKFNRKCNIILMYNIQFKDTNR